MEQTELADALRSLVRLRQCGPLLVRLSWHDAGTYCARTKTGGANACMRLEDSDEAKDEANKGLDRAMRLLEPIVDKYRSKFSVADIWSLAACVAIEEMGGPKIAWRSGREDAASEDASVPNGRLPDAQQGLSHLRLIFYRMGFTDQEIVALSGAHCVGRFHRANSGIADGAWTSQPSKFDNSYFQNLLAKNWIKVIDEENDVVYYKSQAEHGEEFLIMAPSDYCLLQNPATRLWVELYAANQDRFFQDFASAFTKLQEFGMNTMPDSIQNVALIDVDEESKVTEEAPSSDEIDKQLKDLEATNPVVGLFHFQSFRDQAKPWFLESWQRICSEEESRIELLNEIRQITLREDAKSKSTPNRQCFLKPNEEALFQFSLSNPYDHYAALTATKFDPVISRVKPVLIPKLITEDDFFANYFSHVFATLQRFVAFYAMGLSFSREPNLILVGSKNPVKLNSCRLAFQGMFPDQFNKFEFLSVGAPSGVSDQPIGEEETKQGAMNRAFNSYEAYKSRFGKQILFTVGMEGGLNINFDGTHECYAWIAIYDAQRHKFSSSRTGTFTLPKKLTAKLNQGFELGHAHDLVFGTKASGKGLGTVGALTGGVLDRTEYYRHATILALIPFANLEHYIC